MKWYEDPRMIPPEELARWKEEHPGEEFKLDHEPEVIEWDSIPKKEQDALLRAQEDIKAGRVSRRILRSEVVERVDEETGDTILSRHGKSSFSLTDESDLMGSDLPPKRPGTVSLEDLDDGSEGV